MTEVRGPALRSRTTTWELGQDDDAPKIRQVSPTGPQMLTFGGPSPIHESRDEPVPRSSANNSKPQEATATALDAIRRISRALRLAAQETQSAAGVSAAQLFVLHALVDGAEASVSELAERTMTDRSSVASVVERLLTAKLVSRATSDSDRRRAAITITAKGRAVLRKAPTAPTQLLLDAIATMPKGDVRGLANGLSSLVSAMGIDRGPSGMLFEERIPKARSSRSAR